MNQLVNVLLTIDKTHTHTHHYRGPRTDCGPGLGGLNSWDNKLLFTISHAHSSTHIASLVILNVWLFSEFSVWWKPIFMFESLISSSLSLIWKLNITQLKKMRCLSCWCNFLWQKYSLSYHKSFMSTKLFQPSSFVDELFNHYYCITMKRRKRERKESIISSWSYKHPM